MERSRSLVSDEDQVTFSWDQLHVTTVGKRSKKFWKGKKQDIKTAQKVILTDGTTIN